MITYFASGSVLNIGFIATYKNHHHGSYTFTWIIHLHRNTTHKQIDDRHTDRQKKGEKGSIEGKASILYRCSERPQEERLLEKIIEEKE